MENGKTEEEIAFSLGDPRILAKQFSASYAVQRAESSTSVNNILRAVLAVVGLGFFNLVFVLGPFLGLVGVLVESLYWLLQLPILYFLHMLASAQIWVLPFLCL